MRRKTTFWVAHPLLLLLLAFIATKSRGQICAGQQNFPQAEESEGFIGDLTPGVPANATLCPQHWIWFKVRTRNELDYTQLKHRSTNWTLAPQRDLMPTALSVMLDAGYDEVNSRFTTLSFIAVNGTPPSDILRADPYDAAAYSGTFHYFTEYTDRETVTFGFNDTFGGSCHAPLAEFVYFGVRCVHPLGANPGPCTYNLTVTALPHYLRNGMQLDGYLRPLEAGVDESVRHYFRVALSPYEMLQIDISRQGDGRELHDASGASLSLGLAGGVYMQRFSPEACPANGSSALLQLCAIGLNDTQPCTLGHACSARDAPMDDLVLMVEAVVGSERPVTFIDQPNSKYEEGCLPETLCAYVPNLVDRFGRRPSLSAISGAEDRMPRYNVPRFYIPISTEWHLQTDNKNELRADRGVYTLRVTQLQYSEGDLVPGEQRPGCVGYGQWRYFRIATSGAQDASLMVHAVADSGRGLGGVYVRQHRAPSALEYTAMTTRGSPASSPQRVTVSPCDLNVSTNWYIAVMLEDEATATSRGVPPTTFMLSVHLENALLNMTHGRVNPRGGDAVALPAAGKQGDGFVCCGVFKYFLVPRVPAHLSLRTALEVTSGTARAVFLKARSCPAFPDDVRDDVCLGHCTVSWVTRFDAYDGLPTSKSEASLVVPNGLGHGCPASCPADLRHGGDWYVGVQALPGTEAEFALDLTAVEPPPIDKGHECDPSEPECRAPLEGDGLLSAAPARASGAIAPALLSTLVGAAVLLTCVRPREDGG